MPPLAEVSNAAPQLRQIGHLMQVVHANPVYDLQLLEAIDGGLEALEDEIVACYDAATGEPIWMHADKARFWERFAKEPLNERQIKAMISGGTTMGITKSTR